MSFVDVILPLPLEGMFTYSLPDGLMPDTIVPGMRVIVPVGKTKTYIAIAHHVHDIKPPFEVRNIVEVVDKQPVLLPQQMRLWEWIAKYYMSPIGEVYKAAMPSGMKERDGYKSRTEKYVMLPEKYRNERAIHVMLDILSRYPKQTKVMTTFLYISHYDTMEGDIPGEPISEVSREELINESHCTTSVLKSLIDKGFLQVYDREVGRLNINMEPTDIPHRLNEIQQDAYNKILMEMYGKNVVLLHGVTSSGKTEIYIHLIEKMLKEGKQVMYLLPEIALTVQMTDRLKRVFGNKLGIYHSKYSDAERVEIWQKQLSRNPYKIILGARSAVFLPYQDLGLVIIDEEHEQSFKQQDPMPRYHARSAAIMLATMCGAKTLLGTATPSAESYHNAKTGKYGYVRIEKRYKDILMPQINIVDIKDFQRRKMMNGVFSPTLLGAMRQALDDKQQVMLFQNRRGFSLMIECHTCGWVPHCTNCDVALTMHKTMGVLTCHYCGYTYRVPDTCPSCGEHDLRGRGYGTEKVEDQIMDIFPKARIARMDLDTTRSRSAYERIINDFSAGRTNILIGTQMITKGLDFGNVSVVGILNADSMFNMPDFRAFEHAYMMIQQVSGRAGRKHRQGQVYLQTKNPAHPVVQTITNGAFETFFEEMMEERRTFCYPPFYNIINIFLRHSKEEVANTAGIEMASRLRQGLVSRVLGPDKPPVARIKGMHIRKILLKLEKSLNATQLRQYLIAERDKMLTNKQYAALMIYYDVDPS